MSPGVDAIAGKDNVHRREGVKGAQKEGSKIKRNNISGVREYDPNLKSNKKTSFLLSNSKMSLNSSQKNKSNSNSSKRSKSKSSSAKKLSKSA